MSDTHYAGTITWFEVNQETCRSLLQVPVLVRNRVSVRVVFWIAERCIQSGLQFRGNVVLQTISLDVNGIPRISKCYDQELLDEAMTSEHRKGEVLTLLG